MKHPFSPRRRWLAAAVIAAWSVTSGFALAQSFPTKPIKLVVPYAAGGPTDSHLRVLAQQASAVLGQAVVVENKPGANGTFGAAELARAQADGHTLAVLPASTYREPT